MDLKDKFTGINKKQRENKNITNEYGYFIESNFVELLDCFFSLYKSWQQC